ncbi:MAG: hypothetical protein M3Q07_21875 [Pseudobdellovibrionaceae bacterium]|nr:hypothetical protein [Pseudobdellovibrionaceae bacterium]
MTDFSRLWTMALSLGITTACQNEPPVFHELDMAPLAISVAETGYEGEVRDNLFTIDDAEDESNISDEGRTSPSGKGRPEGYAGSSSEEDEEAEEDDRRHSADQDAEPSSLSPSPHAGGGLAVGGSDAKAVAKACAQHFKGIASKLVVYSPGDSLQSLALGPNTVLAIRLAGNKQSLNLALTAGQPLAGICFVLHGHESSIQFTSASPVTKMVYLAAGDQARGDIRFGNGLDTSRIELSGHAPQLNLSGVDSSACDNARLRNHSAEIRCVP